MIGPGTLILVVGPSGAGKDTLIELVRAQATSLVFPRRVVTRPASEHEEHDSMTPDAFAQAERAGAFALSWQAHGLGYGVPAAIDDDIRAGRTVVCNVSRAVVAKARERYARCAVVLVTAPPDVLADRIRRRNRASDGNVTGRVERVSLSTSELAPDLVIENIGAPETAAHRLLQFIEARSVG